MKHKIGIKTFTGVAALALGLVTAAPAQTGAAVSAAEPAPAAGLLGSRYSGVSYDYLDLTGPGPDHADGFAIAFNQPLRPNFDLTASYDWARASFAGVRATQQDASLAGTAYANLAWGKPFAMAAAGWGWVHGGGAGDDSFVYKLGVGSEFAMGGPFYVTPFVNFVRATSFGQSEFDLGVKAEYRLTREWGLAARVQYDAVCHDRDQAEYALGVNYHF